jgi:hypothetical protein
VTDHRDDAVGATPDAIDPLTDALRALPRERAGEDFTARVLRAAPGAAAPAPWPRSLAALAALLVLVAGLGAWSWERERRREELRGRVEALWQEQRELERALADLRRAAEPRLLYLGGNDRVDLVLDLDRLESPGPRPASLTVNP